MAGSELGVSAGDLIKDTQTETFAQDVVAESQIQPVLVDFWAPWCGPCKQLAPILEKVVRQAGGKVKLVKMDIDQNPQIPGQLGVRSIPAIVAFQDGQPIDGFMGALPESQIRNFIERLVGPLDDGEEKLEEKLAQAEELLDSGEPTAAAEVFASILREDPSAFKALAGLIRAFAAAGEIDSAKRIAASVPAEGERDPAIVGAKAVLELAEQAASVGDSKDLHAKLEADSSDHQARFDLAIALNARGERDAAADQLLEIVRRDRNWNDDGARKQLLQFFEAWGLMDPATLSARRKLSGLMFS